MNPKRMWMTRALLAVVALAAPACGGTEPMSTNNPCGIDEREPNDLPSAATGLSLGGELLGCVGSAEDVDYLEVVAPADKTGGFIQVSVSDVGAATPRLVVYDTAGTGEMGRFAAGTPGGIVSLFLAVGPGRDYRLAVGNEGALASPYTYKITTTYTPVADTFEPNDSRDRAASITLGAPVQAFTFAGRQGVQIDPATYDDYYRFPAGAGVATVKLEDVPADLAARVFLYRPDGTEVARVSSGWKGGTLLMTTPLPLDVGDHVVSVTLFTGEPPRSMGDGSSLPAHFTQPYKLTVTQP